MTSSASEALGTGRMRDGPKPLVAWGSAPGLQAALFRSALLSACLLIKLWPVKQGDGEVFF